MCHTRAPGLAAIDTGPATPSPHTELVRWIRGCSRLYCSLIPTSCMQRDYTCTHAAPRLDVRPAGGMGGWRAAADSAGRLRGLADGGLGLWCQRQAGHGMDHVVTAAW